MTFLKTHNLEDSCSLYLNPSQPFYDKTSFRLFAFFNFLFGENLTMIEKKRKGRRGGEGIAEKAKGFSKRLIHQSRRVREKQILEQRKWNILSKEKTIHFSRECMKKEQKSKKKTLFMQTIEWTGRTVSWLTILWYIKGKGRIRDGEFMKKRKIYCENIPFR